MQPRMDHSKSPTEGGEPGNKFLGDFNAEHSRESAARRLAKSPRLSVYTLRMLHSVGGWVRCTGHARRMFVVTFAVFIA